MSLSRDPRLGRLLKGWLLLAGVCLALAGPADAQVSSGGLRGVVEDAEFGGVVPEASVQILELDLQQKTGEDGFFFFESVAPGSYTLVISKAGYERVIESAVVVTPGSLSELAIRLRGEYTEMEELVVRDLELTDTSTELGLLSLRGSSLSFQDSVSKELMSKAGASDAAGALKLVVGASLVDGKYATVRGLSDRYVGAALNGLRVPSSDPKRRAVHMDVFPAGTIESITVSKTFIPDLPGDYTGGGINIRTLSLPEKPFIKASFSREYNADQTGKPGYITYEGGGIDRWGRHRGARGMPEGAADMDREGLYNQLTSSYINKEDPQHPNSPAHQKHDRIVRSLAPAMGIKRTRVPTGHGYSFGFGDRKDFESGWAVGGTAALTYSRKYDLRVAEENSLKIDTLTSETNAALREMGTEEVKWSTLASVGLTKGDRHSVTLTGLRNRSTSDKASILTEEHDLVLAPMTSWEVEQGIHYTERALEILQLKGSHKWDGLITEKTGLELEWYGAHNIVEQEEPDVRFFSATVDPEGGGVYKMSIRPTDSGTFNDKTARIWRNTKEDNSLYGLDLALPFKLNMPDWHTSFLGMGSPDYSRAESPGKLKFGWLRDYTTRWFKQNSFNYVFATQAEPYVNDFNAPAQRPGEPVFEYEQRLNDWKYGTADGQRYLQALQAYEEARNHTRYLTTDPDFLLTDIFSNPDNIGSGVYQDSMLWHVIPKGDGDVSYIGQQNFRSGYAMIELPMTKQLKLIYGARVEQTYMHIVPSSSKELRPGQDVSRAFRVPVAVGKTNEDGSVSVEYYLLEGKSKEEATVTINEDDWLRSAGLIYQVTDEASIRANWSQTIARPTFLELAPVVNYDYINDENFVGNKDLKISHIVNYDLRGEWFPKPGQVFAGSLFAKQIEDPIDKISFGSVAGDMLMAVNYPHGYVRGYELEARRQLDFLPGPLSFFSLGVNYTLIDAKVEIPSYMTNKLSLFGVESDERDMEGQPKFLFNVSLTYDLEKWGTSISLFANTRGEMLKSGASVGLGSGGQQFTPDVYVDELTTINLTLTQKILKHYTLTLGVKNLYDPLVREFYRLPDGQELTKREYHEGVRYTFGLGASW